MLDGLVGGLEIGAVILAAAVLIAFVLMRPGQTPPPRCHFDGYTAVMGAAHVGDYDCTGPAEYRWSYAVNNRDSMGIAEILVCLGHIQAAEDRVVLARELVQEEAGELVAARVVGRHA